MMAIFMAVMIMLQLPGCAPSPTRTRTGQEEKRSSTTVIPGWDWYKVEPGQVITIIQKDDSSVTGTFKSIEQVPPEEYGKRYIEYQRTAGTFGAAMPSIRDSVVLDLNSGKKVSGWMVGFDKRFKKANSDMIVVIRDFEKGELRSENLFEVAWVHFSQDDSVPGPALGNRVLAEDTPLMTAIYLKNGENKSYVPLDKIVQVRALDRGNGATTAIFVALGIAAVLVVIVIAATSGNDEPSYPPDNGGYDGDGGPMISCPFAYSFDGRNYLPEMEMYAGAIYKAAQRCDFGPLHNLKDVEGTYRIRIKNELEETQFIDQVSLLAVDHAPGVQVVPSTSGELLTFPAPQTPLEARDDAGDDILNVIRNNDEKIWTSNPLGRNPDDPHAIRDGINFKFLHPKEAGSMKLALNLQNTPWSSYMFKKVLEMQGTSLPFWYDTLNHNPIVAKAVDQAILREGALIIKTRVGEEWKQVNYIREVGSSLPKETALRLDIQNVVGDTLQLRLESTVGFWTINSVRADFTSDRPITVTELTAKSARDDRGNDILAAVKAADGDYFEMPNIGDSMDLVFAAPHEADGMTRSFILKSTGYYNIHMNPTGAPQKDFITHLMTEPGAFGRFTLTHLNNYLEAALTGE